MDKRFSVCDIFCCEWMNMNVNVNLSFEDFVISENLAFSSITFERVQLHDFLIRQMKDLVHRIPARHILHISWVMNVWMKNFNLGFYEGHFYPFFDALFFGLWEKIQKMGSVRHPVQSNLIDSNRKFGSIISCFLRSTYALWHFQMCLLYSNNYCTCIWVICRKYSNSRDSLDLGNHW